MNYLACTAILLAVLPFNVMAENNHQMNHSQHMAEMMKQQNTVTDRNSLTPQAGKSSVSTVPVEAGQGGFAAIAEIVGMLQANPETDWSKVNINVLREHLLAMDHLVTGSVVSEQAIKSGMRFNVTGQGEVLKAIQHMVPAHAGELNKMAEFTARTETIEGGIALIITGRDEVTIARIKGLGFFGLMATGSHHQTHHYMMATGQGHGMHH